MKSVWKALIMCVLTTVMLASCHSPSPVVPADSTAEETKSPEPVNQYPYQFTKLDGRDIVYLNTGYGWGGNIHAIDFEEPGSVKVDIVRYNRNRKAEKELGIKIKELATDDIWDMAKYFNDAVLAGEPTYDLAYVLMQQYYTVMYNAVDLYTVSTIHLDQEWWPQSFIDSMTVQGSLYGSIDYTNLHSLTFTGGIYFNLDMVKNHHLGNLYDDVRNNVWTYDKMGEYIQGVANLNGDTSFYPYKGGRCVYGMVGYHNETPLILMQGSGKLLMGKDETGMPTVAEDLGPLYNVYQKLSEVLSQDGHCVLVNTNEFTGGEIFWAEGRGLFLGDSICGLLKSPESQFTYGVLPLPKYDEAQESYYSPTSQYSLAFLIPNSAKDAEISGLVADYMNYSSLIEVYPTMLDAMCYKGLHDDDSVEMLNIILTHHITDIGHINGWTQNLFEMLMTDLVNGENRFMSLVESGRDVINNAAIDVYGKKK